MKEFNYESFREKLSHYNWPGFFMFKFIVPADKKDEIFNIFSSPSVSIRPSKTGKYVGVTSHVFVTSEDAIIDIYKEAAKIEGIILL